MKKLIRSTSIFRAESGPSASVQPMQAQPADAWEAPSLAPMQTVIVTTKVQPTRWREPEPIDTGYTESYERECIQQAQCPELPPSRPVTASEALGQFLAEGIPDLALDPASRIGFKLLALRGLVPLGRVTEAK